MLAPIAQIEFKPAWLGYPPRWHADYFVKLKVQCEWCRCQNNSVLIWQMHWVVRGRVNEFSVRPPSNTSILGELLPGTDQRLRRLPVVCRSALHLLAVLPCGFFKKLTGAPVEDHAVLTNHIEQVELAPLEYVWWWNNERLHGELDMRTPAEVEAAYYAETEALPELTR